MQQSPLTHDAASPEESNGSDIHTMENINHYYHDQGKIDNRLQQLEEEWDVERMMELQTAVLAAAGVLLTLTGKRRWLVLPLCAAALLATRAVKGTLNIPILRTLGYRTRAEIDKEKYALKALRGDFKYMLDVPNAVWSAVNK